MRARHLEYLGQCVNQCAKYEMSLNLEKYQCGIPSDKLLDHTISIIGIAIDLDKIKIIVELKQPDTVTSVQARVDHVSYYQ